LMNAGTPCRVGWTLPATSFDALGFDREGLPLLLTGAFGVFRREPNGVWTHLTPSLDGANAVAGLPTTPSTLVIGKYTPWQAYRDPFAAAPGTTPPPGPYTPPGPPHRPGGPK